MRPRPDLDRPFLKLIFHDFFPVPPINVTHDGRVAIIRTGLAALDMISKISLERNEIHMVPLVSPKLCTGTGYRHRHRHQR